MTLMAMGFIKILLIPCQQDDESTMALYCGGMWNNDDAIDTLEDFAADNSVLKDAESLFIS